MGGWRKLHNKELLDLYFLPSVIRIIKSRMRWAGHIVHMGRTGLCIGYWCESQSTGDHKEDQEEGG
jgi:hypothetical protein